MSPVSKLIGIISVAALTALPSFAQRLAGVSALAAANETDPTLVWPKNSKFTCSGVLTQEQGTYRLASDQGMLTWCDADIDDKYKGRVLDACKLGDRCEIKGTIKGHGAFWWVDITSVKAAPAKFESRLLKAPYPAPDDYTCHLMIDKQSVRCDLALFMTDGKRARVQFNNDDSGHMVIFEGKISSNDTVIVDGVTVGYVEGEPKKVRFTKATGLCVPRAERNSDCHAQAIDGRLYEASVDQQKEGSKSANVEATEIQCVPKSNAARILQSPHPNDIAPRWGGESRIGTSWTFIIKEKVADEVDLEYAKGDLVSPRGGVEHNLFILKAEWDCRPIDEQQKTNH
jgi:hypothetical protein